MWFLAAAAGGFIALYGLVAVVDPWDTLPFSPPLPRVPITGNARFTMPALARSARFDSAVVGSSSSRLLRPERLDALFGRHFANLAMNAATAWEQAQVLGVFTRAHPHARTVILGLDTAWCTPAPQRLTARDFPGWMYHQPLWHGYFHIANIFALQEAAKQLAVMIGLKRPPYGLDGYTSFVPPEDSYDPARAAAAFTRWGIPPDLASSGQPHVLPTLPLLATALAALPAATRKILFFTPAHIAQQGTPGSDFAAMLDDCKRQVVAIARGIPSAEVLDFMIPSPITTTAASYWDPVHYRVPVADRLMTDLASATAAGDAHRLE